MAFNKERFEAESETTSLLRAKRNGNQRRHRRSRKYRLDDICITSKAAWLTLLWCFGIGIVYGLSSNPSGLLHVLANPSAIVLSLVSLAFIPILYVINGISLCFYPLSGYLADNVVGKYKMIVRSLQLLLIGLVVTMLLTALFIVLIFTGTFSAGFIGMAVAFVIFYIVMNITFIGFNANVIQFGMEQIHDSPAHHQSLFISCYVWIYYLMQLLIVQPWNVMFLPYQVTYFVGGSLYGVIGLISFGSIASSLCVAHCRKHWFLITPSGVSPYKLVYKVTRFARQHKVPIRRSAFTYCEDKIPTGLDLAKYKYGGPFTTEEVENVKAFYGILKVLLSLGPIFFFSIAADPASYYVRLLLDQTSQGADITTAKQIYQYFLNDNIISSIVVIILIPLYIVALHLFQCRYNLNMLKQIGLGIIFLILTLASIIPLIYTLLSSEEQYCITIYRNISTTFDIHEVDYVLPVLPQCLLGISNFLLYTALYEFLCAQSPPSMKGVLIGLSFAIKGIFQAIGAAFFIPFFIIDFIGCNVWYYGINVALAIVTLVMFSYFARRYQYRQRDDFCDVYRYAEEYYSNTQEEQFYD